MSNAAWHWLVYGVPASHLATESDRLTASKKHPDLALGLEHQKIGVEYWELNDVGIQYWSIRQHNYNKTAIVASTPAKRMCIDEMVWELVRSNRRRQWVKTLGSVGRKSDLLINSMCGMTRWDGQPGNHAFQLLSKHGVSPCSTTMRKCQTKQMPRSQQLPLWRTGEDHQDALVLRWWRPSSRTWNPITSHWMKQLTWLRIVHSGD